MIPKPAGVPSPNSLHSENCDHGVSIELNGTVNSATIKFSDIKPHGGDQRWAFEEMCFQLFAKEFALKGDPTRREGSGGDAGMEGYIADPEVDPKNWTTS